MPFNTYIIYRYSNCYSLYTQAVKLFSLQKEELHPVVIIRMILCTTNSAWWHTTHMHEHTHITVKVVQTLNRKANLSQSAWTILLNASWKFSVHKQTNTCSQWQLTNCG